MACPDRQVTFFYAEFPMFRGRIVIFGLTVSSSWGNGHATLWRGLCRALAERGYQVTFFERDLPFYANARDLTQLPGGGELRLYAQLDDIQKEAQDLLRSCDLAIVTSFCPDSATVTPWLLESQARIKAFYDLDTPVTLDALQCGRPVAYLPAKGLRDFDLVLSYTGGRALEELRTRLGATRVAPLYGWVDPQAHRPVAGDRHYLSDLSYLGTYAEDRQCALETLLIEPARRLPDRRFLIGGAQYPESFPWTKNIFFHRHVPPPAHPAFFCSSRWTLNVTRRAMAAYGYCPSGRLFEAAACGVPLISDAWEGLETFFIPGEQIVLAHTSEDVVAALHMGEEERQGLAARARAHVLAHHTAAARVTALEEICAPLLQGQLAEAV